MQCVWVGLTFKSGLDAATIWLWGLLKCSVAHLPRDCVYTMPRSVNGRPQPPLLLGWIYNIHDCSNKHLSPIKLKHVRTKEMHLLPEIVSNSTTASGAGLKSLPLFSTPHKFSHLCILFPSWEWLGCDSVTSFIHKIQLNLCCQNIMWWICKHHFILPWEFVYCLYSDAQFLWCIN